MDVLAAEIRDFLVANVARTGGHLGPNLGVVELTLAIHRVFSSPRDAIVFDTGLRLLDGALRDGLSTLDAIVSLHVGLLASSPDTLIARKAGDAAARAVTEAAREVRDGRRSMADFDASLRSTDNRLNPGTTADLVAGTLLAALLTGVRLP